MYSFQFIMSDVITFRRTDKLTTEPNIIHIYIYISHPPSQLYWLILQQSTSSWCLNTVFITWAPWYNDGPYFITVTVKWHCSLENIKAFMLHTHTNHKHVLWRWTRSWRDALLPVILSIILSNIWRLRCWPDFSLHLNRVNDHKCHICLYLIDNICA